MDDSRNTDSETGNAAWSAFFSGLMDRLSQFLPVSIRGDSDPESTKVSRQRVEQIIDDLEAAIDSRLRQWLATGVDSNATPKLGEKVDQIMQLVRSRIREHFGDLLSFEAIEAPLQRRIEKAVDILFAQQKKSTFDDQRIAEFTDQTTTVVRVVLDRIILSELRSGQGVSPSPESPREQS